MPVSTSVDSGNGSGSNQNYVHSIAGNANTPGMTNGNAAGALFHGWAYSAVDAAGNLYIADTYNNAIRRMTPSGVVSTVAGDTALPGAVNGTGDVAEFQEPAGIAVTADGRTIYVADSSNNLIRRVAQTGPDVTKPTSWTVSTVAGTGSIGAASISDTPGDTVPLNNPEGLAMDQSSGTIYIAEQASNRIRSIHLRGADPTNPHNWIVGFVAGDLNGSSGLINGQASTARFHFPYGIAIDSLNNLYVADEGNNVIRKITSGKLVTTLSGSGTGGYLDAGSADSQFSFPVGVAVDNSGNVFVADYSNQRIREVFPNGVTTTVAGNGTPGHVDGPGGSALIEWPVGIALLPNGTLIFGSQQDYSIRAIDRSFSTGR